MRRRPRRLSARELRWAVGLQEFLDAISDTNYVGHQTSLVGRRDFDPDSFDPTELQRRLDLGRLIAR